MGEKNDKLQGWKMDHMKKVSYIDRLLGLGSTSMT